MGRPERPLDPGAGPVERLAHQLRELRRAAGNPSYRAMAAATGVSATTLSRAAGGERLPSLDAVRGYVRACGGDPGEWEPRWKEVEAATAEAVREEAEGARPPYRGLARFEPGDRPLFFGRERMAQRLERLVCDHRLAVLFGASGSGKSSLLRAGLIPGLQERAAGRGSPTVLRILTPGARPAATYGHLLTPEADEPECWVVVDQFEEVFTLCRDQTERARFIDLLLASRAPGSRLRVLLSVHADFYARCLEHRGLADALSGAALALGPMTADELREAVVRPAAAAGLLVERELTARLVDEVLDEPGGLPMLSHALQETWRRRKSRMLTLAAYQAAGGVRGAIAATAEEVYGQLDPEAQAVARRLLLRMVEPGNGTPDTRRPLTRAELAEWADPAVPGVVEQLARARLLTTDEDGAQLAHEALLTCWPRLAGWLEEDRERLRHHRRLAEAARAWLEHDRDPGTLYRGTRLDLAREQFTDPELTAPEREFLAAALHAREAERRTAAQAARRTRLLLATLSAVLAVALTAGLVAWTQHQTNEQQRTDAAARRLAVVADSLRTTDPRAAMLLGAAAWRTSPLPESRRALLGGLAQPEMDAFTDPEPGNMTNDFLADSGRTLLSIDGRTWRTWDVTTHRRTATGTLPDGAQVFAAGPDARILALSTGDGLRLWDTARGRWTGDPRPLPRKTTSIAFGGSGRSYLVSDPTRERVQLRSVPGGRLLSETRAPDETRVAPSSDDRLLAVCPAGRAPQVSDVRGHRTLPGAWQQADGLCTGSVQLVFGPGRRFAAADATGVHVWDTGTGRQVAALQDPEVTSAAFSPDGAFLATADGTEIKVWRLAAPDTPVFRHSLDEQQVYGTLAWDPGHPALRYLEGRTVHSFDTTTATTAEWRARAADATLLAPDGRTAATAERIGARYRFVLRDTGGDGHGTRTLPSVPLSASSDSDAQRQTAPLMAFSPDGKTFAYGLTAPDHDPAAQRITVWDLTRARVLTTLDLAAAHPSESVQSLALGPAGRTLYAARPTGDGSLLDEVWDVTGHRRSGTVAGLASTLLTVRPDGRLLAGEDRAVRLPSGRPKALGLLRDGTKALAFTADGSQLAAGDRTGRVVLWDGDLHRRAGTLPDVFPDSSPDSPETISALALSADGRTLAAASDAGTLQLWDTRTLQPIGGPLQTPGEAIDSLAFAADSRTLFASGAHVPLQRYTVDPAQAVRRVCTRAGGDLTGEQWRTYVPDTAYRKVCG
ncbi:hypothetical protein GCM10022403_083080 [Streptomyces coacervatus]|uniref:HTH cro/C1-type domain-containing protein n=1 Tax=Streptomyces coacervatus TaxID=647381 RepID=A0ABP7J9W6_9ACTN|nr:helix-turn-helix domain-containing protein [Streptomyces coacervatus]MDF2270333.1 helix-turn-helix domain-containing protein [Streptomyces coacervatus]